MLRALRGAAAGPARAAFSLHLRRSPARPLRSRGGAALVARVARRPRAEHVALSRADADLRRRAPGDAWRRLHAALSCTLARPVARPRAALHQGRIAQPDELLQGPGPVRGDHAREIPGRDDDRPAHGGQRRQRRGGVCRSGGARVRSVHPERRQAALRRRMPAIRRQRDARRRPHHRRRPPRRGNRQAARLVRRVDAEGAVSHRGQEDHGLRACRADRLALARLDHLSDRRRHRHGRHVESLRRARTNRLDDQPAPAADGFGSGRKLRADRARVPARHREGCSRGKTPPP